MKNLNQIDIISVDCINPSGAIAAINYCKQFFNFGRSIIFTDNQLDLSDIECVKINKIKSTVEYSNFIFRLNEYLNNEFVLIVQSDGYIVNPSLWTNDFLLYDYIGAPWPIELDWIIQQPENQKPYFFNNLPKNRVGNGGFSLRSRKFLEYSSQFNDCEEWGEDSFLCLKNYNNAIDFGIKFAPFDLALKFSYEIPLIENGGSWNSLVKFDLDKHFGFHSNKFLNSNELLNLKNKNKNKNIEVFLRHCFKTNVGLSANNRPSWWNKEKVFNNFKKTLNSQNTNYTIIFDECYGKLENTFLKDEKNIHKINCGKESKSFLETLNYILCQDLDEDTIIYFLEDDYVHKPNWDKILIDGFKLNFDYVTLYDHLNIYQEYCANVRTKIFIGDYCHWMISPSTTNTFATKLKTLKEDIDIHIKYSTGYEPSCDYGKFLELSEVKGRKLISSIPGYSTHCHKDFLSPLINWEKYL